MAETTGRNALPRRGIRLLKIYGIDVRLDYSWFIIFFLVLGALAYGYFPSQFPGQPPANYWLASIAATLLLFLSLLVHELTHSVVAIRSGIKIPEITFFVFGGVSRISEEAKTPQMELKIAAAGPLSSFVLAAFFGALRAALFGVIPPLISAIFGYLAFINVILGVFNLVPGFPLDGGRILRAALWWRTGSMVHATRIASNVGKGFAWALMLLGGVQIFSGGLIGGLWLIFIGMFLRGLAEQGYQELVIRKSIEGVHVREVMLHDPVSVEPELTVDRLIHDYFLKYCYRGFPVVKDGVIRGLVNLIDTTVIPPEARGTATVAEIMHPVDPRNSIGADASLAEALRKMAVEDGGRLLVLQQGRMVGMITKAGMFRFLEMRKILST